MRGLDYQYVRRLLKLLERREPTSIVIVATSIVLLMALNWTIAAILLRAFQLQAAASGFNIDSAASRIAAMLGLVLLLLPGPMLSMAIRDWWLKRIVRRRLHRMDCLLCSYPLSSIHVGQAIVCCPECGIDHHAVGQHMLPASVPEASRRRRR